MSEQQSIRATEQQDIKEEIILLKTTALLHYCSKSLLSKINWMGLLK